MSSISSEFTYPFDPSGKAASNRIPNETQILTPVNWRDYHFIIPDFAPFFAEGFKLTFKDILGNVIPLEEGKDFYFSHHFIAASAACGKQVYGSISILNRDLKGTLYLDYQTIGGIWTYNKAYIENLLTNVKSNPRIASWDSIVELPATFPVIDHEWELVDMVGMKEVTTALAVIADAIANPDSSGGGLLTTHMNDTNNPHQVTKAQTGLGNVSNFPTASDFEASQGIRPDRFMTPAGVNMALTALVLPIIQAHLDDKNNPHKVSKLQVGLDKVNNFATASPDDAKAGTADNLFVTPKGLAAALTALGASTLSDLIQNHITNHENPHEVNKDQVGLGNVQNYGIAPEADAILGESNELYMTPLMVAKAISALAGDSLKATIDQHIGSHTNPHQVTAEQTGVCKSFAETSAVANAVNSWTDIYTVYSGSGSDVQLLIAGGEAYGGQTDAPLYLVRISTPDSQAGLPSMSVLNLNSVNAGVSFGLTTEDLGSGQRFHLFVKAPPVRTSLKVTNLTVNNGAFGADTFDGDGNLVITVIEPAGITYSTEYGYYTLAQASQLQDTVSTQAGQISALTDRVTELETQLTSLSESINTLLGSV